MEKMLRTPYSYHTPLVLNTEAEAYSVPLRTLMFIPTYLCAKCLNLEGLPKHDLGELSKPNMFSSFAVADRTKYCDGVDGRISSLPRQK